MIIALVSKKGGVGKTTSSVNLSAAMARAGRRVLLVDLDPNAGASLSLGAKRSTFGPGSAGVLNHQVTAREAVRPTGCSGLDLIPASVDLRSFEAEVNVGRGGEKLLAERLSPIRSEYDFIFLDCPSSLCLLSRNALAAADAFVVPAVPHFLALEGLEQLVATAERMRLKLGEAARFLGIVLTVVDYRVNLTRANVSAIRQRFGDKVFAIEVRTNVRLAEAPAYGKSIFDYDPHATGATAYALLADEIELASQQLGRRQESSDPPPAWAGRAAFSLV